MRVSIAVKVTVSGTPVIVTVSVAVMVRGSPIWVKVMVPVELIVRVSAVMLEAVAALEIIMVEAPLIEVTVVPAGMPVPEISWPVEIPVRLDTDVMDVLPEVTMPVGVTVLAAVVAVALADITMVVPLAETTIAPDGMPVPPISWPGVTPVRLATAVMFALPVVTLPVVVKTVSVEEEEAVGKFEITMLLAVDETTVVPAGMPAPEMVWPVVTSVRLNAEVMVVLPAVTTPKTVKELVRVAAFDITMVETPLVDTTVVPAGMPVPLRARPGTTLARLDTPVMEVLPEVMRPVNVLELFPLAVFDITTVNGAEEPMVEAMVAPD